MQGILPCLSCLQDFCFKFVGNPATTIVSSLLGDVIETTQVLVAMSCVLVESSRGHKLVR